MDIKVTVLRALTPRELKVLEEWEDDFYPSVVAWRHVCRRVYAEAREEMRRLDIGHVNNYFSQNGGNDNEPKT